MLYSGQLKRGSYTQRLTVWLQTLFKVWRSILSILTAISTMSPGQLQQPRLRTFFIVQSLSRVQLFATPWTAAHQASLSITSSRSLLKLMSIESVMPSNHLTLCHPLLLLPSIFSSIRIFSSESVLGIRQPEYWSFSFSISLSTEYSGLISFRIDQFDLEVQGTLKSLLQHQSSKESLLWCLAFFMAQLSHPYRTNGKTIDLTIWTFFLADT